ncbi:hypothetical protein ACIOJD_08335 [Streptomyces sp. NPDC088116]|uniref:hypothetical protein n=1 Tax=Streptomyces sp. NPDC088116 TaxID=3365825 RepID=UPI00382F37ED
MAASAQLLLSALSKRTEPAFLTSEPPLAEVGAGPLTSEPAFADCPPLTSEPAFADYAPLTSEPPLAADTAPLTSEPTAYGTAGCNCMEYPGV